MGIKVLVKVFAMLRNHMEKEVEVNMAEGANVSQLLDLLISRHPGVADELFISPGVFKPYVNILKNGRNISFINGMDTSLEDNDVIAIFPPVAGG